MPPKNISRAARRLRLALTPKKRPMSRGELAANLGVSHQAVHKWLSGTSRPGPDHMAAIERLLGIPMAQWTQLVADEEA